MIDRLASYTRDLLGLFFPAYCEGCGSDRVEHRQLLCLRCLGRLPATNFFAQAGNPVEKTFYGRLKIEAAGAAYYFTADSLLHHLITQLKYHGNQELGIYLGELTAAQMRKSDRFIEPELIIPLPLNLRKLRKRGYNQATLIAEGMAKVLKVPVRDDLAVRKLFTETQTKKDRVSRWQNMQDVFDITRSAELEGRRVLLVDDIITTGATLEACGNALLKVEGLRLDIATVGWTI